MSRQDLLVHPPIPPPVPPAPSLLSAVVHVGSPTVVADDAFVSGWGVPDWRDEFAGTAGSKPNSAYWSDRYAAGEIIGTDDDGWLDPANTFLDGNGHLILQSQQSTPPAGSAADTAGRTWSTSYLWTSGKLSFKYGRWETRYRSLEPSHSEGVWPAFWLRDDTGGGELDVTEAVGTPGPPTGDYPTNGSHTSSTFYKNTGVGTVGTDRTAGTLATYALETTNDASIGQVSGTYWGWHTAVLIWIPGRITTYIDGTKNLEVLTGTTLGNNIQAGFTASTGAHMRWTVHMGSSYAGHPSLTNTRNPTQTIVDYVRHWAYDGSQT